MGRCRPHIGLEGARSRPRSRPRVARVDLESIGLEGLGQDLDHDLGLLGQDLDHDLESFRQGKYTG